MKVLAALALPILAAGCAPWGDSFTVIVDPAFNDTEKAAIVAAADRWQAAVPVELHVREGLCSGIHDGEICVRASDAATVAQHEHRAGYQATTVTTFGVSGGEIYVDVAALRANAEQAPYDNDYLFGHELGHAQGLKHGDPDDRGSPGALMYFSAQGSSAGAVTCLDALRWEAMRGLAPSCR